MKRKNIKMNPTTIKQDMDALGIIDHAIITKDEDIKKEVEAFCENYAFFDGFIDVDELSDGVIKLVCTDKIPEDPIKNHVPAYHFDVVVGYEHIGEVTLRVGFTKALYYAGHIGYGIQEKHRGKGYAIRACELIKKLAIKHEMKSLYISNNYNNKASIRVCQKLGAKYIQTVLLPENHDMRKDHLLYVNIWIWDI